MRKASARLLVAGIVCAALSGAVWAGDGAWTSGGPEGGPVEALVFDPAASSTLYAGTRYNAVFRSADGAAGWVAAGAGLPRGVRSLAITSNGTLFAIGDGSGVLRSTDDGASWQQVLPVLATAIAADPSAASTLYAGTSTGRVYKTTDAGANWTSSAQGLPQNPILLLAVDPQTASTLYLGADGEGAYKSTDGGTSWTAKSQNIQGSTLVSLVIDPLTPSTLYIASNLGLFRSTDGADSWTALGGPSEVYIGRLAIDPSVPSTLLGGSFDGIFRSFDSGASWAGINNGVPPAELLALAVDPSSSTTFYAGTGAGVIKSVDGGASWAAANAGLRSVRVERLAVDPSNPDTLYAASPESGIFRSLDRGASWAAASAGLTTLAINDLALAPSLPQTLYAAPAMGLARSQDSAGSWSDPVTDPENFGLLGPEVTSLAVDPLDAATLFAANRSPGVRGGPGGPGIMRSLDGAVSWLRVFEPADVSAIEPGQVVIDPGDPDRVLAGLSGREVQGIVHVSLILRSLDGGATWAEELRRTGEGFVALDYDPFATSTVYGVVDPGDGFAALRSFDGGDSWNDLPLALPCVNDLLPDPELAGILWAACDPVYTSDDGGSTWAMFDGTGFPAGVGGALALARAAGAAPAIHAGTPVGVWSYDLMPAPQADLAVSKDDGLTEVPAGGALTYAIEVTNLGPEDAVGAGVTDDLPAELACTWSCAGSGGGVCDPAPPAGDLAESLDLPAGAAVTFTASCAVDAGAGGALVNTAAATPPAGMLDPVAGNDAGSDTTLVLEIGPCGAFEERHLSNVVLAGSETIEACSSITAGPAVEVASAVLFRAPSILLTGWSLTAGSFAAVNELPTP